MSDCKEKLSPVGSGYFNTFVDISKFNRDKAKGNNATEFDEIFGVYRRNNDDAHIIFSGFEAERENFIRISTRVE